MWVTDNSFQQAAHVSSLVTLPHSPGSQEEEKGPGKEQRDVLSRAKADSIMPSGQHGHHSAWARLTPTQPVSIAYGRYLAMCNVPFLARFKDTLEIDLFTVPVDYYIS